jgi:hypothetical protein
MLGGGSLVEKKAVDEFQLPCESFTKRVKLCAPLPDAEKDEFAQPSRVAFAPPSSENAQWLAFPFKEKRRGMPELNEYVRLAGEDTLMEGHTQASQKPTATTDGDSASGETATSLNASTASTLPGREKLWGVAFHKKFPDELDKLTYSVKAKRVVPSAPVVFEAAGLPDESVTLTAMPEAGEPSENETFARANQRKVRLFVPHDTETLDLSNDTLRNDADELPDTFRCKAQDEQDRVSFVKSACPPPRYAVSLALLSMRLPVNDWLTAFDARYRP